MGFPPEASHASLGVWVACFLAFVLVVSALCVGSSVSAWAAEASSPRALIIYYANETAPEAVESRNYLALFSMLRSLPPSVGLDAEKGLRLEAKISRSVVDKDIEALIAASRLHAFDVAIFTNNLALLDSYLSVRGGVSYRSPVVWPTRNIEPVTEYSPL